MTQEEFLIALANNRKDPYKSSDYIFLGDQDDLNAPFTKQSGNYFLGDYINFNEPFQRPGTWKWEEGYSPTGSQDDRPFEEKELNPMLMQALINQKNRRGIESLYNYDLVDAKTIDEQSNADDYDIPEEKKKNIFASIIDLMSQGGIGKVLADSFRNKVTNTPSMQAWRNFSEPQYTAAAGMYQPGGILQGYNPVSMFGKGPMGTLQDRRRKMLERQILGKSYSQKIMDKVNEGIEQLGGDRGPTPADLSAIGRKHFTGPGKAFAPKTDTFTGGKTVKSSSTPGGYYSSPK